MYVLCMGPDLRWQRVLEEHILIYDNQEPWLISNKSSPEISLNFPYSYIF